MASEQFSLCWDNFHKNMSSGLNALLENEDLVDVTLAVEGKFFKAHQMVLSVCSPYFKELFKTNPCQHPIVFLKDVSYVAISDLLQFMYQGEVQVSQDNLTTFIKTAEALQIKGLTGDGNGTDADSEPTQDKPVERQVEETYKPMPRPKKAHPAPIVTTTPAVKKPRLSLSSNDQPAPAPVTKTEPTIEPSQFKVEPFDPSQSVTIPDDGDETFGDDTLDDTTVDDNEDYSMMEGEEPQAGTSTDGAGEGQGKKKSPKISLKTIIANQKTMLQRQSKFQKSLETLTETIYEYFNKPHDEGYIYNEPVRASTSEVAKRPAIEPIGSPEKLTEFEEKLKQENYMLEVVESMSYICGRSGTSIGIDCCYKLIDHFLTRSFATQCSWTGNTRLGPGMEKVPLKFFENFRKCFRSIITLADSKFTEAQNEDFFKRILKNSVRRQQSTSMRQSKHKNRPKNLKYNFKDWRTDYADPQFDELLDEGEDDSYIKLEVNEADGGGGENDKNT